MPRIRQALARSLNQVCPKCSGKRFAVNGELRIPDRKSSNVTFSLPAITVSDGDVSVGADSYDGRKAFGHLEVWICLGCGYTEHYAVGLPNVEQIARAHPHQVTIVDAGPQLPPYR